MTICPIDTGRYGRNEMCKIFSEENRLQKMLDVEAAVARAQAYLEIIPKEAAVEISTKASIRFVKLERCKEIESEIKHDVMAVVKALTEV